MLKIKKIDHVAIAVNDIQSALSFWQDALGLQLEHVEDVPGQQARVAFLPVGESRLELVQPTSSETSTARFLKERGGGMHHLCMQVDDIDGMLIQLQKKGVQLINETALVAEGRRMAFIHPRSAGGVLVELYEITENDEQA